MVGDLPIKYRRQGDSWERPATFNAIRYICVNIQIVRAFDCVHRKVYVTLCVIKLINYEFPFNELYCKHRLFDVNAKCNIAYCL